MVPNYNNLKPRAVWPWLLGGLSDQAVEWSLIGLGWAWQRFRTRPLGMYEILDYDSTLELCDPRGERAVFKRFQKVRFLQNHIIAFQDSVWGDGELFEEYTCVPGVPSDFYQEGERWNVLISLRETKSRGDVEDIYVQRTVRNGFVRSEEWRQTAIWHPTHRLRLAIIFPKERPCKRAILQIRRSNKSIELDPRNFRELGDGRQMITWEKKHPKLGDVFTLRWTW